MVYASILSSLPSVGTMADSLVQSVLAKASEEEAEKLKSIQVDKAVDLEYDVGNLLAFDINDLDLNQFR